MKARFELSHLPEHKTSAPTLVLRFLEYISRIERLLPDYEGSLLYPEPGHLLQRRARSTQSLVLSIEGEAVWSCIEGLYHNHRLELILF